MKRKIAVVTSSRADYAHLRWLLRDLSREPKLELHIIALGSHFSPVFGATCETIFPKNFIKIECLLDSDTDAGMAKSIGVAMLGVADVLDRLRPDILFLIADRYEMLAPAAAALALRIPIAHVEGGEITFGAVDDAVRNALTKMSHLHFACTRKAAERIANMGEERWRITFSGSLSLDPLCRERPLSKAQLITQLGFALREDAILCIHHPVTLMKNTLAEAYEVLAALSKLPNQLIFVYPNADAGSREIIEKIGKFVATNRGSHLLVNLEHLTYLSLLKHAGVLVGNSSSGIIEGTSLEVPVVNIGIRQRGRDHAANVIDVPAERSAIQRAIAHALTLEFRKSIRGLKSPYGDGRASAIIKDVLLRTPIGEKLLFKHADLA